MNEVQPIRDKRVIVQIQNYLKVTSFRNYIFFYGNHEWPSCVRLATAQSGVCEGASTH